MMGRLAGRPDLSKQLGPQSGGPGNRMAGPQSFCFSCGRPAGWPIRYLDSFFVLFLFLGGRGWGGILLYSLLFSIYDCDHLSYCWQKDKITKSSEFLESLDVPADRT